MTPPTIEVNGVGYVSVKYVEYILEKILATQNANGELIIETLEANKRIRESMQMIRNDIRESKIVAAPE